MLSLNEPRSGPLPLTLTRFTSAQPIGVPLLSLARHNSTRLRPEPPLSETVQEVWYDSPVCTARGDTSKALTVGAVPSTITLIGLKGDSVAQLPAPSTT